MTYLAQRCCGASTPGNMLHADDLRLLLPLNGAAQQAAHMFYELHSLGYFLATGWRCEPPAREEATIYDMMLGAAGGDDTGLSDGQLASFLTWRRAARMRWVSELLQADKMDARCGASFMTHFCDGLKISKSKRCDYARWRMDTDARLLALSHT